MAAGALTRRIAAEMATYPERMRSVAAFVIEHPQEVALLSMREQARRAGVLPATMTRFAQRLGYSGYDELRALYAQSIRGQVSDFGARASELAARKSRLGEPSFASAIAGALNDRVAALTTPERLATIVAAGAVLTRARRIFCLGHRSSYAPAYHFAYVAGLYGAPTRLLDAAGGIGADELNGAGPGDAMLAVSFAPYTRITVSIAKDASDLGVDLVALTDDRTSPLARAAAVTIVVPTEIAGTAYVAAPAFAAAEILAALVVAGIGTEGRGVLERNEAAFARRSVYWTPGGRAA
jgi:DNA-binding MurR/RpiR family transcriptional regulator